MLKSGAQKAPFSQAPLKTEDIQPLKLDDEDEVSLEINGFYDYKERIEDDFNIFKDDMEDEGVMFYSNQELEAPEPMD